MAAVRTRHPRGFDTLAADEHLARRDRKLARWIARIGPIGPQKQWRGRFDPADALARAILYQQLSGKAAATIVGRVEAAIGSPRLHCDTLGSIDDVALRACGVSGNKALALRDLARREAAGEIPTMAQLPWLDEQSIIDLLVPVRGIGRWTVEMMLMFRLGRPDVLPADDLGIRKGIQVLDNLAVIPTPKQALTRSARWAPYRTQASFYLWRIADFGTQAGVAARMPTKRSQD